MVACSVKGCKNRSENAKINKIKFFSFPRNTDIAAKWMKACGKEVNLKSGRICSIHFLPTCYKKKPEYYGDYSPTTVRTLLPDALPTENIEENILYNQRHSVNNILEEINNNPLPIIQNKDLICKILLRNTKDANSFDQPLIDKSTNIISKGGHELEIQCLPTTSNDDNIDDLCTKNINNPSSILPVQDQTAVSDKQIGSENEILQLKKELQKKKKENDLLHKKIKRLQRETKVTINKKIYEILQNVFTPKQIHKIMNPHLKNIKWGIEDIASAVALKSVSPKAYRYLKKNNYPLPGLSTLRNWVSRLDLSEGILTEILALMKRKSDSFSDFQKLIVLCFDEIYISHKAEIDRKAERVVGPHKTCQVSIARGLFTKWKQIIYYGYDQPLTSSIVIEVIKKLYAANYIVIAVTTDLGSGNSKTWKEMNVGINEGQKSFFTHPSNDDLKVFVFADGPHLLKLIRNHYLDRGFFIRDKCISKTCVERMLSINNRDLKVMFKITEADLTVAGQARQKVSTAAKLFSQTTAKAIRWCGEQDFLYDEETWKETAEIFELVNDWFDIFNSKYKNEWDPKKKPYGLNLEYQDSTLNKMTNFMYEMKVKGHKNLLPF